MSKDLNLLPKGMTVKMSSWKGGLFSLKNNGLKKVNSVKLFMTYPFTDTVERDIEVNDSEVTSIITGIVDSYNEAFNSLEKPLENNLIINGIWLDRKEKELIVTLEN